MPTASKRPATLAGYAAVGVLLFISVFWQLGAPSFWDPDEAHYAQTTREMMATGDWLAPYYNQAPFFDKPMLFHHLQGAAMLVLGETELGARAVPALAAAALVLVTMWFATTLLSRETGLVAGLLLALSPATFGLARYAILDTLFTAFLFGGLSLISAAALGGRRRLQYPGYVLVALAVLTKGPVALVLCGLAMGLSIALSRDVRGRLLRLRWLSGLLLVVVIAAPWFLYMHARFGQAFISGYVLDENVRLFASARFGRQPSAWFYVRIIAEGFLPWTGILAGRLFDDVRAVARGRAPDSLEVLLWSWTAAVVGFFTLSTFKLDHYVFPAAPALCVLCARGWIDASSEPDAPEHAGVRLGAQLVGPLLVGIGLVGAYLMIARLGLSPLAGVVPLAMVAAGVVTTMQISLRRLAARIPWTAAGAIAVAYVGVLLFVMPALESRKVVPDIARWVDAHAAPGDRVASYQLNRWNTAFRFYVNRHTTPLEAPGEADAFFGDRSAPFYCAMLEPAYEAFVARGVPLTVVYAREGMAVTSGRALWREQGPPARFVIVTRAAPASAGEMERHARDDRVRAEE